MDLEVIEIFLIDVGSSTNPQHSFPEQDPKATPSAPEPFRKIPILPQDHEKQKGIRLALQSYHSLQDEQRLNGLL